MSFEEKLKTINTCETALKWLYLFWNKELTEMDRSSHQPPATRFRNIHRTTPMLESLFNTVEGLQACIFIKKRLHQHRYFPVNITKFLRVPILKNTCERLPLNEGKLIKEKKDRVEQYMTVSKLRKTLKVKPVTNKRKSLLGPQSLHSFLK